MTQTQPDRLDQLESMFERMDRKLDAIATDIVDIKISQARTDERFNSVNERFNSVDERFNSVDERFKGIDQRFNSIDGQLNDIKTQLRAQDNRVWTFITAIVLAGGGLLAKSWFFPQA